MKEEKTTKTTATKTTANAEPGEMGPAPEASGDRYSYYRRCSQLRRNGERCKAPAMKGETVCYSHLSQEELRRYHDRYRQQYLGPLCSGADGQKEVFAALQKVMGAILERRIDLKIAGRLLREISSIVTAGNANEAAWLSPKGLLDAVCQKS